MTRISTAITIDAPPERVWAAIADIATHVHWMADAVAIRFTGGRTTGVGVTFDCDTKVGPLRMTDRMEITEWEPAAVMGIAHVGIVTGQGRWILKPLRRGRTRFTWNEELHFPWWMGGPIGGFIGGRVLKQIWRANLRRLATRVERSRGAPA